MSLKLAAAGARCLRLLAEAEGRPRSLCHTEQVRPHLATLLADFRRYGDQVALVTHRGNRRFPATWNELEQLSGRFAAELARRKIGSGDRVLLWGPNGAEWIAAFFGCMLRGAVAVPLDLGGSIDFARRVVLDVQPALAAGDSARIGRLGLDFGMGSGEPLPIIGFRDFAAVLPTANCSPVSGLSRDTVLQIVFTSGTTGEPKGIVHTHGNVLASLDPLEEEIAKYLRYERWVHPLRFLHTLPLSHVFGQFMGLWVPPLMGAQVHYEDRLEAGRLLRLIRGERISVLAAVPRVLDLLREALIAEMPELPAILAKASSHSLGNRWWRLRNLHRRLGLKFWAFVCGGAALPADLENFWTTAGFALIQGYGMTETTALVSLNHPFHSAHGSIGKPLRGREVKIGPDGEILVRGASIAGQVWRRGRMEPRGGEWLATGDLAAQTPQGALVFAGRKGDVIVTSSGLNIHPEDLEKALMSQEGIRQALVLPYQASSGPAPVAVLIPNSGKQPLDGAIAAANRQLAAFQQMTYWLVWPQSDFPHTSSGKLLRRQVAKWAQQTLDARHAPGTGEKAGQAGGATDPLPDSLLDILRRLQPSGSSAPIAESDRLAEDLHLDSLALVQLETALETAFGFEIDDAIWPQVRTVADLRRLVDHHPVDSGPVDSPGGSMPHPIFQSAGEATEPPSASGSPIRIEPAVRAEQAPPQTFPRWPWWPPVRALRIGFLELVLRPLVRLLLAPKVEWIEGDERRRLLPQPSLLIANHVTAFDPAIALYALAAGDRDRTAIAMSAEILNGWRAGRAQTHRWVRLLTPLAYWLVTALFNVFPIPRRGGLRQSFAHAGEALDHGYHVLVFPEGRRSRTGEIQPFEPGIGLLAEMSEVPVQPIYLEGLGPLQMHQRRWFRPGTVSVRLGTPLVIEPGEDPAHFTKRLEKAVEELSRRSDLKTVPASRWRIRR